jgi:antitoxin component YwqK of YwqJK toxin-antitoxin module
MAEGDLVDGLRHGRWTGYERNTGRKQSETDYSLGLENGSYTVYNYNGTPRIVGQYVDGKETGEWSFYDQDGNLAGTKQY